MKKQIIHCRTQEQFQRAVESFEKRQIFFLDSCNKEKYASWNIYKKNTVLIWNNDEGRNFLQFGTVSRQGGNEISFEEFDQI